MEREAYNKLYLHKSLYFAYNMQKGRGNMKVNYPTTF